MFREELVLEALRWRADVRVTLFQRLREREVTAQPCAPCSLERSLIVNLVASSAPLDQG